MKLKQIYSNGDIPVSFEVFPPKNDFDCAKSEALLNEIKLLKKYNPQLISITYGAGGTNRDKSLNLIRLMAKNSDVNLMPHFTCVNSDEAFVDEYLNELKPLNIENILALRGDIPEGMEHTKFEFKHASDLINYIKPHSDLSIAAACYPEGHIEAESIESDIMYLKQKVELGVDVLFTQLFFDNNKYYEFVEKFNKIGVNIPVIAGIMPVVNYKSLQKMLTMCRVTVPTKFLQQMEKYQEDADAVKQIGIEFASNQCQDLMKNGVSGLHFYTLNKAYSTSKILDNISISSVL